ncbi:MAG: MFS transporter [Planctomycetaceae bacterium]
MADPSEPAPPDCRVPIEVPALIDRATHPIFIAAWLANLAIVTANTATFVFAEWVATLAKEGTTAAAYHEELPGRVIQFGVMAALCVRLFLGQAIDRFGVRRVWLLMSLLAFCGMWIFTFLTAVSYWLFVGRILFAVGLAGMFTSGTFHIQSCVSDHRRTEFIALLGSSGFVGMMLGPQLAALLRSICKDQLQAYSTIFGTACTLILAYIGCILLATHRLPVPPQPETRPSLLVLTRRYWPGTVMLVSMAMGVVFTVPSLYLVRFNQHEKFGGIATYWTTYAVSAFVFRIATASLSQQIGRHRMILLGLVAQGLGLWALLPVTAWWHLIFSALLCGFGHALLFPSIVSLGSGSFPPQYRGSGTNLTLGFLDLGAGLSAPLLGRIIDLQRYQGVGYRPMFFCAGGVPLIIALIWLITQRHGSDHEIRTAAS